MGVLGQLQRSIEELVDVDTTLDVTQYVVDEATRHAIPGAREGLPEQLFIRQSDENVELALYVASDIVTALERDDPHQRLHGGNLQSFCVALEGVSHFVFLTWRALMGRPVSALELELQAEVDKFVAAWLLLLKQGVPLKHSAGPLARQLFEGYTLRDDVLEDEEARYHTATRAARRYCTHLASRFSDDRTSARIEAEARTFYRRGLAEKMYTA